MIQTVVFDLGRVLLTYEPEVYLRGRLADAAVISDVLQLTFGSAEWAMLDRGTLDEETAIAKWIARRPDLEGAIRYAFDGWYELLQPLAGSVALLEELKANGYRLLILSNFHRAAHQALEREHHFFELFDGAVFSYEAGLLKPEPQIYQLLIARYGLTPAETLFIDDMADNVAAAKAQGLQAVQFQTPAALRTQLLEMKLL